MDLVSAGSGQLQLMNMIARILAGDYKLVFLDEPDAHMHEDLQLLSQKVFQKLSVELSIQFIVATHSSTIMGAVKPSEIRIIDNQKTEAVTYDSNNQLISAMDDIGIIFPPYDLINVLKNKKVIFVEGLKDDFRGFLKPFGMVIHSEFETTLKNTTVIPYNGASNAWPFDAIDALEEILGTELNYVFLGDRDLFCDQILRNRIRGNDANKKHIVHYLEYRNRECYFLNCDVLSRIYTRKYSKKNDPAGIPHTFSSDGIRNMICSFLKTERDVIRAKFNLANQPYTHNGEAGSQVQKCAELNEVFRVEFEEILEAGNIPFKYLDGKTVLPHVREFFGDNYKLHFSDNDYFSEITENEIPEELKILVVRIEAL